MDADASLLRRETIRLAGRVTPEELTPEMRTDLTDLHRRWRAEG